MVICCANADAETIRPVVEELEKQGHMVALLDGVEQSPEQLAPTVERLHGEGLYVLCRSKALGRNAVDELRDILLAHHVPFGRTLTVASTRPRELRERIGASLRRLATSKARRLSTVAPEGPSRRGHTQLGMAPPPKKKPQEPVAAGDEFESEVPTDVRPGLMKTQVGLPTPKAPPSKAPPPPPPPTPTAKPPPRPAPVEAADEEPPARLTPALEPEPQPQPEPEPAPEPVSTALTSSELLIRPDDLADLDDVALPNDLDEMPTADMPVRTGNTTVAKVIPPVRTGDTALVSRETLLAAGLEEEPPFNTGATVRSPAVREPVPEDDDAPPGPPWKWIGLGGAALALVAVLAIAFSGDDDTETSDDDTTLAQTETPKTGPRTEGDDAPMPEGDDAVDVQDEDPGDTVADGPGPTRIGHALRSREIRALDVLLVSNTEGPLSFEDARAHCSGLALGGLASWRLPEVGELMSLTEAAMTGRGYYWTNTPADTFGDTPLVWWARRNRVVTRNGDNYVLCVRGGTAAG